MKIVTHKFYNTTTCPVVNTDSRPTTEVKRYQANAVFGWVTAANG